MPIRLNNDTIDILDEQLAKTFTIETVKTKGTNNIPNKNYNSYGFGYNGQFQLGFDDNKMYHSIPRITKWFKDNNIHIKDVASGLSHTIFLDIEGNVYGVGNNSYGQLGIGNTPLLNTPQVINYFEEDGRGLETPKINITQIACGSYHTMFLASDGKVYGCGDNFHGQLGIGNNDNQYTPEKSFFANDATKNIAYVACGEYHTIFLVDDNSFRKVYAVGFNGQKQLGLGNINYNTPQEIGFESGINIIQADCGGSHTMFLANDGKVYGVGNNSNGQLGIENTQLLNTPQEITLLSGKNISQIACGSKHTIFLEKDVDGNTKVYGVGNNSYSQLGIDNTLQLNTPQEIIYFEANIPEANGGRGDGTPKIKLDKIACGDNHTMFLDTDGNVYGIGSNEFFQLSYNLDNGNQYTPRRVEWFFENKIKISKIVCGLNFTICLELGIPETNPLYDGQWTYNDQNTNVYNLGNVGIGTTEPSSKLDVYGNIKMSGELSKNDTIIETVKTKGIQIVKGTGLNVYGFGINTDYQLGYTLDTLSQPPAKLLEWFVDNDIQIIDIVCGESHTMFLDSYGKVYGVGNNSSFRLGYEASTSDQSTPRLLDWFVENEVRIVKIACGNEHTMFLDSNGNVYGIGRNNDYQLGNPDSGTANISTPEIVQWFVNENIKIKDVDCGAFHTIFLDTNGNIYGIGNNFNYQIGYPLNTNNQSTPQLLQYFITNNIKISKIACGAYHTIMLDLQGNVYGVGKNLNYQLGYSISTDKQSTPRLLDWFDDAGGTSSSRIVISDISCGENHTMFLDTDGNVYGVGNNSNYELGYETSTDSQSTPRKVSWFDTGGVVGGSKVIINKVSSGSNHTIFLDSNGNVYGIGKNNNYQSGNPDSATAYISTPEIVQLLDVENNIIKISKIACGKNYTMCLEKGVLSYERDFDAQWTYSQENANVYHLGNVGIGTTNPSQKLDVVGDINFTGNLTQNGVQFSSYNDSDVISLLSTSNITLSNGVLDMQIGTAQSSKNLDVQGDINFTGILTKNGVQFSSYNDSEVISLLSTSNITLSNEGLDMQIGTAETSKNLDVKGDINFTGNLTQNGVLFSSYNDSEVISLLSTSNITLSNEGLDMQIGTAESSKNLDVKGDINFTGNLTQNGVQFSSYNDSEVISLLSTSNITLFNGNVGIGTTDYTSTLNVAGNVNISVGSRYLINGSDLSFNDIQGTLGLDKGGIGTSLASIDDLKALLGISTYEITDISPVFLDLTITTSNKETLDDGVEYMKPIIFTIYGKNFDRNVVIKLCLYDDTNTLKERDINTIYHDSSIQLRVSTKYIPIDVINNASYFKLMMYDKNYPEKKILSREIYRDVHKPEWLYDNDYEVIYNKEFGFKFTINDSDTSNILLYELTDGTHLIPDLSFNSETGEITGVPEILNTTVNLSMNAKSGSKFLTTRNYKLHILSNPIIDNTENQELLVSNTFDLSATSGAESFLSISGVDTSIIWSLIGGDTVNISLSDNTIEVTDLNLLGDSGTYITVQATDAYGYSITKLINVKKTILNGPTIHTGDQELLVYDNFDLSATSAAESIAGADTSITWSLIGGDTENISLSGNTITVTNLNLLGDSGTDITVEAKDAYDFKETKTINVIKTILNGPTIHTGDQELLVYDNFDLSATSAAESIAGADTSITWSLIGGDTENISLSGNTITVTNLDLLGDSGTNITVEAKDAYDFKETKTINVIKTILNGPTIHTEDQELSSTNTFDLSATSDAGSISGADTTVYWSLIGVYSNISLSGNTITVTNLDLLGDLGTDITIEATDAYGYSNTKTINVIKVLYEFTSHTFTNAGATGSSGPTLTQCKSSYSSVEGASWTQYTDYFNMTTQGVQLWTVPKDGYYEIVCYGAKGGDSPATKAITAPSRYGGKGAIIKSYAYLLVNDVLSIVVGQQGTTSSGSSSSSYEAIGGGGGGGSFVYKDNYLYCVGGGGGGSFFDGKIGSSLNGTDGRSTFSSFSPWGGPPSNGYGSSYYNVNTGGNGAGWLSDGTDSAGGAKSGKSKPTWEGGTGISGKGDGGFGGGGGVLYTDWNGPGGGGGYTGANGGNNTSSAGGAGSYFTTVTGYTGQGYSGLNSENHGKVTITFLS